MAIFQGVFIAPDAQTAAKEMLDIAAPFMSILLLCSGMDALHGLMGWEGQISAGDGVLSLLYRRGVSAAVAQYFLMPNKTLLYGWVMWACVISWTALGLARCPPPAAPANFPMVWPRRESLLALVGSPAGAIHESASHDDDDDVGITL